MKRHRILQYIFYTAMLFVIANSFCLVARERMALALLIPPFAGICLFAGIWYPKAQSLRIRFCRHGAVLLHVWLFSLPAAAAYHIALAVHTLPDHYPTLLWSILYCVIAEAIVFWIGILCVYCTSFQLGLKTRVLGIVCGLIPIANLLALIVILRTVRDEIDEEYRKEQRNLARKSEQVCKTRYPLLLVHGVFFRDYKQFNYWGRIPKELQANGASVFYGEHESAMPVADSAEVLAKRIKEIVRETGCEKVNIIAHSKGGLDCRYALSELGIAPYVASLTTVNTPHRGCVFADHYLAIVPEEFKRGVSLAYNTALRKLGDKHPDFLAAVTDLTYSACETRNKLLKDPEGVLCQSIGSVVNRPTSGKFPLSLSSTLIKPYDGINDGLVGEKSFAWGETYRLIQTGGVRGVSHADMIDLMRENHPEFDVREYFVELVHELKEKGL